MSPITEFAQLDLTRRYTYADYLTWKFDEFVELIKGRVMRPMAGPNRRHQTVSGNLFATVHQYLKGQPCRVFHAPFDVRLTTTGGNGNEQLQTVVQPDICVVCDPAKLDDQGCVGAPDWIIEILSPGNVARDTRTKFDLYEESGVREYWMVVPGLQTVAAYVLEAGRYQLAGEYSAPGPLPVATLPGLAVEWADIFEGT